MFVVESALSSFILISLNLRINFLTRYFALIEVSDASTTQKVLHLLLLSQVLHIIINVFLLQIILT